MRKLIPYCAGLAVFGLAGLALSVSSVTGQSRTIIKLHQEKPELHNVDIGKPGHTNGDMLTYEAALTTDDGRKVVLDGYLMITDEATAADPDEDRFSHMVLDFGNGTTLVAAGLSKYLPDQLEMVNKTPRLRAIIGGTGDYMGARGQVSTWRNEDGTYDHTIELIN